MNDSFQGFGFPPEHDDAAYYSGADSDSDDEPELDEHEIDAPYVVLDPPRYVTRDEMKASAWARQWLLPASSDGWYSCAQNRVLQALATEVPARFTHARRNWERATLRSLLEAATGVAVAACALAATGDVLWAAALGAGSATAALVANTLVAACAAEVTRASWGRAALRAAGVDSSSGATLAEVNAARTLLFGVAGLNALAAVLSSSPSTSAAALAAAVSVCMLSAGELFTSWRPTRLVAETLLSRCTRAGSNWAEAPERSFTELACWLLAVLTAYVCSEDLLWSVQAGTLAGMLVILSSGVAPAEACGALKDCDAEDRMPGATKRTELGEVLALVASAGQKLSLDARAQEMLEGFSA